MQSAGDRYESLMQRIRNGENILIDGATGTEVDTRGVPQLEHAWNSGGALTDPDLVREIHEDYLRLGSEIIISNTFGAEMNSLEDAGAADQFEFINRRSVELCIEARESTGRSRALVAGGITHWSWTGRHPEISDLKANALRQATIMRDAGAELIMLEMMVHVDRTRALIEATLGSGLPVWVGFSCNLDDNGDVQLLKGESLVEALEMVKEYDVPLVNIMHTRVEDVDASLDLLQSHWNGYVGVYPNSGNFDDYDHKFIPGSALPPEEFAVIAKTWLDRGVQIIGGCCGVGPDHIRALQDLV